MKQKPIVGGRVFQGPNMVPEIPHGFSQKNAFRPHLPGDFVRINFNGELTPPTLAPVLEAIARSGEYTVDLNWSPSNKTGSPGFGYNVYYRYTGDVWLFIGSTTNLFIVFNPDGDVMDDGVYDFQVIPFNDAGEGVGSNIASVVLPGELLSQNRLIEDGSDRLIEDGTVLLLG